MYVSSSQLKGYAAGDDLIFTPVNHYLEILHIYYFDNFGKKLYLELIHHLPWFSWDLLLSDHFNDFSHLFEINQVVDSKEIRQKQVCFLWQKLAN